MIRLCAHCGRQMGVTPGPEGLTHGICQECLVIFDPEARAVPRDAQAALRWLGGVRQPLYRALAEERLDEATELLQAMLTRTQAVLAWVSTRDTCDGWTRTG